MTESSFVIGNVSLVLADEVVERGWLAVEDGTIARFGEGDAPGAASGIQIDGQGDLLIPGLIELHTDHLETHYAPRPKVRWNPMSAAIAYDAQIAASGITTVFDSLRVGSDADSASLGNDVWLLAETLARAEASGQLRAEHRTHLRCEIASTDVLEEAKRFVASHPVHMISLMDHTPGKRQFRDLDTWRLFYSRKISRTRAELDAFIETRLDLHARYSDTHRRQLVALAHANDITLASHDDTTADHVSESIEDGVAIAEFPTTLEAAHSSHRAGIRVMMGAPNVVRGGSHSGNVAAQELAEGGVLDILSSDYVPASLLLAAFELPRLVPAIGLADAVRMVTLGPARATGLDDRGELAVGKRADLVRVMMLADHPTPRHVFRGGVRVV